MINIEERKEEIAQQVAACRTLLSKYKQAKIRGRWYDIFLTDENFIRFTRLPHSIILENRTAFLCLAIFDDDDETLWTSLPTIYNGDFKPLELR